MKMDMEELEKLSKRLSPIDERLLKRKVRYLRMQLGLTALQFAIFSLACALGNLWAIGFCAVLLCVNLIFNYSNIKNTLKYTMEMQSYYTSELYKGAIVRLKTEYGMSFVKKE